MRLHFNATLSRDFSGDSDLLCKLYQVGRAPVCDCEEAIGMSEEETGETQHIFQPLFVFVSLLVCNFHNTLFVNV